jgi:hypothetical protein
MPAARRLRRLMGSKVRGAGSSCGSPLDAWRPAGICTTAFARIAAATVKAGNTCQARSGLRLCAERDGGKEQNRGYGHELIGYDALKTLFINESSRVDLPLYVVGQSPRSCDAPVERMIDRPTDAPTTAV